MSTNPFEDEYLKLMQKIIKEGSVKYNERTGKNCYFYQGDMCQYDLSTGKFPALTTKKLFMRQMIAELLGFIRAYDNAKDFRDLGCNFWNANANESEHWLGNPNRKGEDDLGRIYGVQARNKQTFFAVKPKIFKKPESQTIPLPEFEDVSPNFNSNLSGFVGKEIHSNKSGKFLIIDEKRTPSSHFLFTIKFEDTGFVKKNVQKSAIVNGNVRDPYKPSICGVAAYGQPEDKELAKILKKSWRDMIYRCYSEKRKMNSFWYYDKEIFVDDRWLLFENFVRDFKNIDRWELKLEHPDEYSLDKDLYCSNKYSVETCVWASKKEQNINTTQAKKFKATSPEGVEYFECGLSNFCEKHNLNRRSAEMALKNNVDLNGWKFEQYNSENEEYRIRIDDQLAHAIAKIKHNPSDRRIIVDHWNPNELHLMALPPCHLTYTFGIRDGHLDMCMYQRSCDVPLGVPMNIASYALLLQIVAQITGLKPGVFTHFLWNIHIYEDQMELSKEQVQREPYEAPTLWINPEISSLHDLETWVTPNDFKLENYQHHPKINFPFSA